MIFVGILLVVSTISNSNMFVNAQQQSLKYKHQNKELFLFLMKNVDQEMNQKKCVQLASVVKGKAVPDYNICDVVVYRQAPPIVRNDRTVLNNFPSFGHYIEMVPAVINNTEVLLQKMHPIHNKDNKIIKK